MVRLGATAARHIRALRDDFERKGRIEAALNLVDAVTAAVERIGTDPLGGSAAPRPYPELERPGRLWIKQGRYWFHYRPGRPSVVLAVFYDMADLPGRL